MEWRGETRAEALGDLAGGRRYPDSTDSLASPEIERVMIIQVSLAVLIALRPAIGDVLDELAATPGCLLARMSGSGSG